MTDIQAVNAQAVSDKVLWKLAQFAAPTRMNADSTQYHIGYERAKADLRDLLTAAVGKGLPMVAPEISAAHRQAEATARAAMEKRDQTPPRWWRK